MKKPSEKLIAIAHEIGFFFLEKNGGDYEKTREFIELLLITNLEENENAVIVETARPVLFIGRKGENIDGLEQALNKKIEIVKSMSWSNYIAPVDTAAQLEEKKLTRTF